MNYNMIDTFLIIFRNPDNTTIEEIRALRTVFTDTDDMASYFESDLINGSPSIQCFNEDGTWVWDTNSRELLKIVRIDPVSASREQAIQDEVDAAVSRACLLLSCQEKSRQRAKSSPTKNNSEIKFRNILTSSIMGLHALIEEKSPNNNDIIQLDNITDYVELLQDNIDEKRLDGLVNVATMTNGQLYSKNAVAKAVLVMLHAETIENDYTF